MSGIDKIEKNKTWAIIAGPLVFAILEILGNGTTMPQEAYHVMAITFWIAIWWISEAIPIYVTSLLPIVLFPLTGALDISSTTTSFGHRYIFLYVGGFILAIAIEKWNLHKRIALNIIKMIGSRVNNIILGFMIATAFLSMWISNTATSVMMLPIGTAIVSQFNSRTGGNGGSMGKALMLAIAYSASIGGFATLIGTPPNLVLAGILEEIYQFKLTFIQWMSFGLPVSIVLLVICWRYLTRMAFNFKGQEFPGGTAEISKMLKELGRISRQERTILLVFIFTAIAWISRSLLEKAIPGIDDTIISMIAAFSLFLLPSGIKGVKLITWEDAVKLPWGIILLFGGGMALAKGFGETGLADWIAQQLTLMNGLSLILLILILVAAVNFLTEVTSNLATTAMLLPVLAPMAMAFDLNPFMIMVSVTIAASCAFMLPVATPPNAVVFGSGYLKIPDMVRTGIALNILSIILITLATFFLLPEVWGFDPMHFPEEFKVNTAK